MILPSEKDEKETILYDSGNITSSSWTDQSQYNRYIITTVITAEQQAAISKYKGFGRLYMRLLFTTPTGGTSSALIPVYLANEVLLSSPKGSLLSNYSIDSTNILQFQFSLNDANRVCYVLLTGSDRATWKQYTYRLQLIGID